MYEILFTIKKYIRNQKIRTPSMNRLKNYVNNYTIYYTLSEKKDNNIPMDC